MNIASDMFYRHRCLPFEDTVGSCFLNIKSAFS
jgi:hypothetical protein